ncbi:hypothetical protein Tco_0751953 [Tanacetum coccineum]|uniref:Uncharacterized protein n=1 Tax=Tanacetum coccineum TaxID=301880 RepID=A0ABQ4Z6D3_9ASTR
MPWKETLYPEPRPLATNKIVEVAEDYHVAAINAIEASIGMSAANHVRVSYARTSPKHSFHVTTPVIRRTDNPRMAAVGLLNVEGCYNSLLSFIVSARNANQLVRELEDHICHIVKAPANESRNIIKLATDISSLPFTSWKVLGYLQLRYEMVRWHYVLQGPPFRYVKAKEDGHMIVVRPSMGIVEARVKSFLKDKKCRGYPGRNRSTWFLPEAGCDCANELPRGLDTGVDPKLLNAAYCRNVDDPQKKMTRLHQRYRDIASPEQSYGYDQRTPAPYKLYEMTIKPSFSSMMNTALTGLTHAYTRVGSMSNKLDHNNDIAVIDSIKRKTSNKLSISDHEDAPGYY